jgi:glycosyltransferase involved in cell wall biosynthesis
MSKVSVIMPTLNVVRYISQCMDSVLNQTLKDLEIIVIDAGSTDGTMEILKEYALKDSRIKLIKSDKKSYGYQMNKGISIAKSQYIGIVETDDVIEADMFEVLYEKAYEKKPDYVKGTAKGFFQFPGGVEFKYDILPCIEFKLDKDVKEVEAVPKETPQLFWDDNFLWNGIYRADFLKKIVFNETPGAAFQDIGALFQIISSAEKAIYIRKPVYNYRRSNAEASSYNKKSVNFANTEYEYIKQYLVGKSDEWFFMYYKKLLGLTLNRFDFMAISGQYWEESKEGIEKITDKLKGDFKEKILASNDEFIEKNRDRILLLFTDPKKLFDHDKNKLERKKAPYLDIIKRCIGRDTIIFGAGLYGNFLHAYLSNKDNVRVKGFCDNNPQVQGSVINNLKVFSLEDSLKLFPDALFLISTIKFGQEIKKQLMEKGVKEENIYMFNLEVNISFLID